MLDREQIQVRVSSEEEARYFERKLIEVGEKIAFDYWPLCTYLVFSGDTWFLSGLEWSLEEISFDQLISQL